MFVASSTPSVYTSLLSQYALPWHDKRTVKRYLPGESYGSFVGEIFKTVSSAKGLLKTRPVNVKVVCSFVLNTFYSTLLFWAVILSTDASLKATEPLDQDSGCKIYCKNKTEMMNTDNVVHLCVINHCSSKVIQKNTESELKLGSGYDD